MEEGCQEEAQWKKAEKKGSQMMAERKENFGRNRPGSGGEHQGGARVRKKMPSRPHKEQLGKGQAKIGTAHKSNTKNRRKRKAGKRRPGWKCNGRKMRGGMKFWNEEGWKVTLCSGKSCKKAPELVERERMSQGKGVKCIKDKKKVKAEEMKGTPSSSLEEDTEEMRRWRGMSQDEVDQCWKKRR